MNKSIFKNTSKEYIHSNAFKQSLDRIRKIEGVKVTSWQQEEKQVAIETVTKECNAKDDRKGFNGVAGMKALKARMQRDFIDLLQNKELAEIYDILPPPVLLYGAHGCGKTYFVRKLAEESSLDFMTINPDSIASSYIHGTQEKIAAIFNKARSKNGTLLFIDEIDSMTGHRRDMENMQHHSGEVAEFLTQLNDLAKDHVYVIAATNHPEHIDRAILRSGRIDSIIYVPLPDKEARRELFELELRHRPKSADIEYDKLADLTKDYTASDITNIVKSAAREVFGQADNKVISPIPIDMVTIEKIISETPSSVSESDIRFYERLQSEFSPNNKNGKRVKIGF